ncbi:SPL family radical SAM protein [Paenibacillus cymbidii]|uniref:SPL family radical SAM protein n=1 Tax=Paenibacillus cymbidii TaxID=1639034 RepID=UPI0010803718|nr:radical SAM protein [Paenibacillus cymbidii]
MNDSRVSVGSKPARRLLNPAGGFLEGYSHTLNPYVGCAFACSYCYVREMPVAKFRAAPWGSWVDAKEGAAGLLRKELKLAKRKGPVTIFMSSATDPYQPLEYSARLTRSLLEVMTEEPPDFVFVQTRSPLVARDIDLLRLLAAEGRVRVSVTVETDLEEIRRAFAPAAPPIAGRIRALRELREAGVPTQAAVAPLLPSSERLPAMLAEVTGRVCIDDYFMGDGSGGKRTERLQIKRLYEQLGQAEWYDRQMADRLLAAFAEVFPRERLFVSRDGFMP